MLILDARRINAEAKERHRDAVDRLERARKATAEALTGLGEAQLEVYDRDLRRFVEVFEQVKNVELSPLAEPLRGDVGGNELADELADLKSVHFSAVNGLKTAVAAGGAGATTAAMTFAAVGTLATASTGTAIGTLSGAAATNATLAWFGGGSLAAGGAGVAGGMLVLGGIALAPVVAVGGLVIHSYGRKALEAAKANKAAADAAVAQLHVAIAQADAIGARAGQLQALLERLRTHFEPMVGWLENLVGRDPDYREYSQEQRERLHLAAATAITIRHVLDLALINDHGELSPESEKTVEQAQQTIDRIRAGA